MADTHHPTIAPLVGNFRSRKPLRAGSLIVTIFGDCITARGGTVWLGSLINVLKPLGISHRLVRTAVYRLVQDGILDNQQVGRRSFYGLTAAGQREFAEATEVIYAGDDETWNGEWTLLMLNLVPGQYRPGLKKELEALGFGAIGTDLHAHPRPNPAALDSHLNDVEGADHIIRMYGSIPAGDEDNLIQLTRATWPLEALEADYSSFIRLFRPFEDNLPDTIEPDAAFYLRTFLIHEYRKVLLRDPKLPGVLLPPDWIGHTAQALTRKLYIRTTRGSERYIDEHFECQQGHLPAADAEFFTRFGGFAI